jgi:rhodanese-related sulfurtransferase
VTRPLPAPAAPPAPPAQPTPAAPPVPPGARPVSELLRQARSRLDRLGPAEAWVAIQDGALLVDIRPQAQRAAEGEVPGALVIERNVLEWRLDPASDARLPVAGSYDLRVIVMCSAGYTSSLAAASLQDLGLLAATDLAGGFQAWAQAGLPVQAPRVQAPPVQAS